MSETIFISYRRSDSQGWAGRLASELAAVFGDDARFVDLDSIPPGDDFARDIEAAIGGARVVLGLIGPSWLAVLPDGRRRLDDAADFVRLEIAAALTTGVRVIPVLLGRASMPRVNQLPADLQALARRQAIELSDERWEYDFERLVNTIEEVTGLTRRASSDHEQPAGHEAISVGRGITLERVRAGDVAGVKGSGDTVPHLDKSIDVLRDAKLVDVELKDIVGIKLGDPKDQTGD